MKKFLDIIKFLWFKYVTFKGLKKKFYDERCTLTIKTEVKLVKVPDGDFIFTDKYTMTAKFGLYDYKATADSLGELVSVIKESVEDSLA